MTRLHWLDHKIPPPVVGALVAAAMWAAADIGPQFELAPQLRYGLAATLVVVGLAFDLLGLLAFRAARTSINPLKPERSTALVTGGVYRVTRNPMYVGMAMFVLAWAVYLSSLLPLLGLPLFVTYITRFQIQAEERALKARFADAFVRYTTRVRRWL